MHVINITPEPPGCGNTVARFDAQISEDIRMFGLKLVRSRSGAFRVYAPSIRDMNTATFAPRLAAELTCAAVHALEETQNDQPHS